MECYDLLIKMFLSLFQFTKSGAFITFLKSTFLLSHINRCYGGGGVNITVRVYKVRVCNDVWTPEFTNKFD